MLPYCRGINKVNDDRSKEHYVGIVTKISLEGFYVESTVKERVLKFTKRTVGFPLRMGESHTGRHRKYEPERPRGVVTKTKS